MPQPKEGENSVSTTVKAYFHHTQFSRAQEQRRVIFHLVHELNGTKWSISFPVQAVMKGFPRQEDEHVGYCHGIALANEDGTLSGVQHNYIGVTKRNWLKRMSEHFYEINHSSNKTFHAAWRHYIGRKDVQLVSELVVVNHTFEQIMGWEECMVDEQMAAGTSLNMIPGGFKGMKFLYQHRLTKQERVSLDERDYAIETYQILNPRTGVPNLLISQLWKNPDYAQLVICGPEGRLSPEQIHQIRELNELSLPIEKITSIVGAKNQLQVQRVLSGRTYSRIQ